MPWDVCTWSASESERTWLATNSIAAVAARSFPEINRVRSKCIELHCTGPYRIVPIQPVQPPPTTPHLSLSTTVKTAIAPDRRHKTKHGNPSFCLLSLDALFKRYCSDFRLEEQPGGRIKMTIHDSCDQVSLLQLHVPRYDFVVGVRNPGPRRSSSARWPQQ